MTLDHLDPSEPSPVDSGFTVPVGDFGSRLQQLAHTAAEFAAVGTVDAVAEVVRSGVASAVQAVAAALLVRDGERLEVVASPGLGLEGRQGWRWLTATKMTPAADALRLGAPVVVAGSEEEAERYPGIHDELPGGSVVCLPLNASGQEPFGVIALILQGGWVPGPRELDFLTTLADACAQALRRIQASQLAEENAARLTFLAEASEELSSSLDYRATLAKVAKLAVRTLADLCAVNVLQEGTLTTLAVEHNDPAKLAGTWQLQQRYPARPDAITGPPNVTRTGVSELYPRITDEMLVAAARNDEHLGLMRELNLRSALVVPLSARGHTLGAITFIRAETDRPYTAADLVVAEDLGRRAAVAIENAQLHSQTRSIALQLQRAVLPASLTHFPDWQIATHYSPSGHADVGGDFYGATELPDGSLVAFIGDVMGHGIAAAAAMAQMRASIRAYLCVDPDPGVVIAKLDAMFELHKLSQLVSLAYVLIDPAAGKIHLANAGHHPPLLIDADGTSHFAETMPRRILGAGGDERTTTTWAFEPGSTLLLYTDGLIERRAENLDVGQERLARHAAMLAHDPLQDALNRLVIEVHDDSAADDVTAIAVRPAVR